jgi:hypothetical protein
MRRISVVPNTSAPAQEPRVNLGSNVQELRLNPFFCLKISLHFSQVHFERIIDLQPPSYKARTLITNLTKYANRHLSSWLCVHSLPHSICSERAEFTYVFRGW